MALIHPRSLERWQEWQTSRHRARQLKHAVTGAIRSRRGDAPSQPSLVLHSRDGAETGGRILIAVDSASPTSRPHHRPPPSERRIRLLHTPPASLRTSPATGPLNSGELLRQTLWNAPDPDLESSG